MPAPQRRPATGVVDRLLADPHRFQFFQAVRLLERWFAQQHPESASHAIGTRLQFRNSVSLSFPASEIEQLQVLRRETQVADGAGDPERRAGAPAVERIEITPAFMGLLGGSGTLPLYYTETLARRELFQKDKAARAFFDIFHHRAVALFYQGWKKHRLALQYENDRRNRFLPAVLALGGLGQTALRDRLREDGDGVHDESLAYFAGTLQQRPMSARQIRQVLAEYFHVPAQVEQFIGRWYTLPPGATTLLGSANGVLGQSAVMGERVWQRDLRLRIVLGPLDSRAFQRFLPGAGGARALQKLLTLLTGVCLEYEVRLTLRKEDVAGVTLSSRGFDERRGAQGRLGWDSFLQTRPSARDRDDVGYEIHASA
ncbi:type VI secretion system baseplate subunit TssG [Aquabacterium sp. A7-Y]|uniref:type VI secretion system baseplate subunit TssG n=1 Tax=Aquabacterium sp. A7-Y TaxID=1349605 RepID=UPI00223D120D|nr:type VI secretion system baseplate subunit TssG [Aquabacterium sp. A7-Y]MCW7537709.1 type VI secretion system baseplate subunit TssG [Aquabacterium sp. A7-Y]